MTGEGHDARQVRGRRAWRRGLRAETVAALFLMLKGYRILGRRMRTPVGELDIVAAKGGDLVFVEVKARTDPDAALEAVHPKARHRLIRAAQSLCARHPDWARRRLRFDVIALAPYRWPRHRIGAFDASV